MGEHPEAHGLSTPATADLDDLGNLNINELLGESADDKARQITNDLGSQGRLALLPFRSKSGLISAMLDGFTTMTTSR